MCSFRKAFMSAVRFTDLRVATAFGPTDKSVGYYHSSASPTFAAKPWRETCWRGVAQRKGADTKLKAQNPKMCHYKFFRLVQIEVVLELHPHRDGSSIFPGRDELNFPCCGDCLFGKSIGKTPNYRKMLYLSVGGKDRPQDHCPVDAVLARTFCVLRFRLFDDAGPFGDFL